MQYVVLLRFIHIYGIYKINQYQTKEKETKGKAMQESKRAGRPSSRELELDVLRHVLAQRRGAVEAGSGEPPHKAMLAGVLDLATLQCLINVVARSGDSEEGGRPNPSGEDVACIANCGEGHGGQLASSVEKCAHAASARRRGEALAFVVPCTKPSRGERLSQRLVGLNRRKAERVVPHKAGESTLNCGAADGVGGEAHGDGGDEVWCCGRAKRQVACWVVVED